MEARKFAIGDRVRLRLNDNQADMFTVSRVLPEMASIWQYRVKRIGDGQERAVSEAQISKAGFETGPAQPMAAAEQDLLRTRNARAAARVAVKRPQETA